MMTEATVYGGRVELGLIGDLLGEAVTRPFEELKRAAEHRRRCIEAGREEPDRSAFRNAWGAIGFYLPKRKGVALTTVTRR